MPVPQKETSMIQLWQHNTSGEYLLVDLTNIGDVRSATGPIYHGDLASIIATFDGGDLTPEMVTPEFYHQVSPRDLRDRGEFDAMDALKARQ